MRQFATHTSGFESVPKSLLNKVIARVGKHNLMNDPYAAIEEQEIFAYWRSSDLNLRPGRFKYSNYGMGLLGHVLDAVAGNSLDALAAEKLPLGMNDTAIELSARMRERLVPGRTAKGEPTPLWTLRALARAAGFNANAGDTLKFIRASIEETHALSATLRRQHAPQASGKTARGWMQPTWLDRPR